MAEEQNEENNFKLGISVLGNQFLKVEIGSATSTQSWAFFGIIAFVIGLTTLSFVGDNIADMFKDDPVPVITSVE